MRELYATELCAPKPATNSAVKAAIDAWADRHTSGQLTVDEASDGSTLWSLDQQDDDDSSLAWRSEVAIGPPDESLQATVRVRLHSVDAAAIAPVDYDFGTPAIVRTILREVSIYDAGQRVQPAYVEVGQSGIPELVRWLEEPARRLPVVVVSRTLDSGRTMVDVNSLAKELAGIAHVRVLAANQAAWALTNAIGASMSVWGGAVRTYFPGFASSDDPRRHRFWTSDRVTNGLVSRVRGWFGTLSASRTPEHAVHRRLRSDRLNRLKEAAEGGELLYAFVDDLERDAEQRQSEIADLQARGAELERALEAQTVELEDVKKAFADVSKAMATQRPRPIDEQADEPLTVVTAMDAIQDLLKNPYYRGKVRISDQAITSGRAFTTYNRPEELLRATHSVLDAGVLFHDNRLGESPGEFFNRRGYGYAAVPGPHLKVDEATSPDQCLRIHWDVNDDDRTWTISHIGRHL